MTNSHSYKEAGVDIDLAQDSIRALLRNITYRRRGNYGMLGEVGHYAGLIDFGGQVLGLTTDGVGTKMLVADRMQNWRTIGIDCIAMNVNDLYVMNLEPIAFVDYIATDQLSSAKMSQIGEGLNAGAKMANINIVGGETATLKGLITGLDLAGTCLGVQEKGRVILGKGIRPGDLIIGVPSSGIHSNGLTLARRIVEDCADYDEKISGGRPVGEDLLTPTRIYSETLKVTGQVAVHGMCHVTGGGLRNFTRLTEYGFEFTDPLEPQAIFSWLQETGSVPSEEMYLTFNMGMGYAFIAPEESVAGIQKVYPDAKVVGTCVESPGVKIEGKEIR
jgi:phosphoribosylformylglycinamidine cyclo-ligase